MNEIEHDSAPARTGTVRSMLRAATMLALFAAATTAAVAITKQSTAERIEANARALQRSVIDQLLPPSMISNNILTDVVTLPAGGLLANEQQRPAHIGRRNGEIVGIIIPLTAPDAYNGRVRLLMGVRPDGELLGVRALEHRETPGLGDKVDIRKSDWILGFNGKSLQQPAKSRWKVRRDGGDFDQFTGATITPRAVVAAVRRGLEYFAEHREQLLQSRPAPASNRGEAS